MFEIADTNNLFTSFHTMFFDVERIPFAALALVIAMIIGAVTGPLMGRAVPAFWIVLDLLFGGAGMRLDRVSRNPADLMFRGFMFLAFVMIMTALLLKLYNYVPQFVDFPRAIEVLVLAGLLSCGALWHGVLDLYKTLEHKDKPSKGAYFMLSRTALRDLNTTDEFGLTRLALATLVRQLDKGAVLPVLWYLIGGIELAVIASALSCLAWRFGKDGFGKGFGTVMLGLDKLIGFVPTLLAAFLVHAASVITPGAGVTRSVKGWNAAPYEQGGAPVSVLAHALNVSIGGPVRDIFGSALKNEWVGPKKATAKTNHQHLRRGLYLTVIAHILLLAVLGGAYIWGSQLSSAL